MKGDNKSTIKEFSRVSESYGNIAVHRTNYQSNVTYSTDASIVRKDLPTLISDADLHGMVDAGLRKGEKSLKSISFGEPHFMAEVRYYPFPIRRVATIATAPPSQFSGQWCYFKM